MKNIKLRSVFGFNLIFLSPLLVTNLFAQYDPDFELRINSGGSQVTYLNETFLADQDYTNGAVYTNAQANMDELYTTERYSTSGNLNYNITLANGDYLVILHFAEIFHGATGGGTSGVGARVFDINLEGQLKEDNLDIYAEVGPEVPLLKTYTATVNDGVLNVHLSSLAADGGAGHPKISGLEIHGVSYGEWNVIGQDLVYNQGNIGIGTNSPGTWKLAVNGKIRATEIKVETGWADYVFEKDYYLPSLEEVEKHILEKGHLINIPSAEEVEANGIEVGEMNRLLLEKIEELTLYMIQLKKDNILLREEIKEIKSQQ